MDDIKDTPSSDPGQTDQSKPDEPKPGAPAADASSSQPPETPKQPDAPPKPAAPTAAAPPKAPAAGVPSAEKPAPPRAPATPGEKPPPAKKGPTITVDITGDPVIDRIKQKFGDAITEAVATLGQQIIRVKKTSYAELCRFLRDDEETLFDLCSDLTAVHWPARTGEEFDVVVQLYSVQKNRRLRV